jgi:hypothetical protein
MKDFQNQKKWGDQLLKIHVLHMMRIILRLSMHPEIGLPLAKHAFAYAYFI